MKIMVAMLKKKYKMFVYST